MNKVWVLPPREDWIVDRFVKEWNEDNADISTSDPNQAEVIWLLADWCFNQLDPRLLVTKKILTTIHHIVPEKFGVHEQNSFRVRDQFTTAYHVYNQRTFDFIRSLTQKPIHIVPYWANQRIWRPTGTKAGLRAKHGLPLDAFIVGSFQRDTEGAGISQGVYLPKKEKGPDLLVEAIRTYCSRTALSYKEDIHVVLAGWRRQYVIERLRQMEVSYTYLERPPHETVNELYQTLDLYPVTARHEGGPQSLIECGLLDVPVVSRPVGIAEQVLPASAIHDDVSQAIPAVPNVEAWKLPNGYQPYRDLIASL